MTPGNEKKLFDRFKFFKPDRPLSESLMAFGFEVGDGWFQLIWDLCEAIDKAPKPDNFEVIQVKEKFGGLRFYCDNRSEEVEQLIREAEWLSIKTCERCGQPGSRRGGGWLVTLCDTCDSARKAKPDP